MRAKYETKIAELTESGIRKFATAKQLMRVSEEHPELLVPRFRAFCRLLDAENNIIRWSAIRIVANLAAATPELRLGRIMNSYLAPITGPAMITAANTIQGAALIARSRKRLTPRLIRAILQVEHARYQTDECRNVAIGHAIKALGTLAPTIRNSREVVSFVMRQRSNSRPGTRRLAESYVKRLAIRTRATPARRPSATCRSRPEKGEES